ncbi:methyltransferase domain-containing protein [Candidatus Pacearchaeota archaeon]|nr:methyltransferase domain-containing protein [Candidatus Pacearchaeota archaeon]
MVAILFPGRHHMLTEYQHNYLQKVIDAGLNGEKVDRIIFAITSADHANTRRNPVPLYLRVLAIEKFSRDLPCEVKIYPIPDVKQTNKFAEYIIHQIEYLSEEKLNSTNAVLACSTPSVISLFKKLGFKNLPVELINVKKDKYSSFRPYEVIDLLVKAGNNWRKNSKWKEYASRATQEVYAEYSLGDRIIELFSDSLLNEDADLTDTRDYNSYAKSMDQNIEFKFRDIKPFVVQGKIVDAGCGTGALVWHLSKCFEESDVIGIEATRRFYEYCKLQEYPNPFVYFYRRNVLDQNFKENTINTFIYSSVLHEIYSYINKSALTRVLKNTYNQLASGGRIIIRDVVGPKNGKEKILMELTENDGKQKGEIKTLSTYAKFHKFVNDFIPRKIKFREKYLDGKRFIEISMRDAYEFISKMNYADNWQSEMHEEFGFWSFEEWREELNKAGFDIVAGSHSFKSKYIVEKMYGGKVKLCKEKGNGLIAIDYPDTNMILVGEKSKIS